jgi:hypothetical protein
MSRPTAKKRKYKGWDIQRAFRQSSAARGSLTAWSKPPINRPD